MRDYADELKHRPDEDLFRIIGNAGDYHADAVHAAQHELDRRGLAPERVDQLREQERAMLAKQQARSERMTRASGIVDRAVDTVSMTSASANTATRIVLLLSGYLAFSSVYNAYTLWQHIPAFEYFPEIALFGAAEAIGFAILAVLIYRRSRIGYFLVAVLYTVSSFFLATLTFVQYHTYRDFLDLEDGGIDMRHLIDVSPPVDLALQAVLAAGLVWLLARPDLRELFDVEQRQYRYAILYSAAVGVVSSAVYLAIMYG